MSTELETSIISHAQTAPALPPPKQGAQTPAVQLSPQQRNAIEMLVLGNPVVKVAEAIGVDRGTIYRWRNTDPNFIAALNGWRGQLQAETRDRVLALSAGATDSVATAIAEGDARLGLRVLEKMGCLKPGPDNPIDPYAVFGIGLADEEARGPVIEGFRAVARHMTPEQAQRAPQLLALGVAIENRRAGRAVSAEIKQMAGPLPDEEHAGEEGACMETTISHVAPAGTPAKCEPSARDERMNTGHRVKTVFQVSTRVTRVIDYR